MRPWNPNTKSTGRPGELNPAPAIDRPGRCALCLSQRSHQGRSACRIKAYINGRLISNSGFVHSAYPVRGRGLGKSHTIWNLQSLFVNSQYNFCGTPVTNKDTKFPKPIGEWLCYTITFPFCIHWISVFRCYLYKLQRVETSSIGRCVYTGLQLILSRSFVRRRKNLPTAWTVH